MEIRQYFEFDDEEEQSNENINEILEQEENESDNEDINEKEYNIGNDY